MAPIQVLIVDDDALARGVMESYTKKIPELHIAGSCKNAFEAFSILNKQVVDVILLDINMPEINGITLIKMLKNPPCIIFISAYSEFAVESYELNAVDYLLKPISYERFLKAINKVKSVLQSTNSITPAISYEDDILFAKSDGKLVKIDLSELLFVEEHKDMLRIQTLSNKYSVHSTLQNMEQRLAKKQNFIKVNKSHIVNMNYVTEVDGNVIRIKENVITIGSNYADDVYQQFDKYKLV